MNFSGEKSPSSSFGYDNTTLEVSDDELEYKPLSWRLDLDKSMSDWTNQIVGMMIKTMMYTTYTNHVCDRLLQR